MSKKLSITLDLENGKNLIFSISDIKEIATTDAANLIKNFDFTDVLAKNDVKTKKVKKAQIISTSHEEIEL